VTEQERSEAIAALLGPLDDVVRLHEGRGAAHEGITALVNLYKVLLQRRLEHPCWELRPFVADTVDRRQLVALINTVLPCDVLVEHDGDPDDPNRDRLYRFGPEDDAARDALRVLQCQLDAAHAHIEKAAFTASSGLECACPFYTACPVDLRKAAPDTCRDAPWQILAHGERETCWYGAGVGGLLGKTAVGETKDPGDAP